MHTLLQVPTSETMSNYSCNTENSMAMGEVPRSPIHSEHGPKSPSSRDEYSIKTLCFSKQSSTMPTKDEYTMLLGCGLGARKWQVSMDFDKADFQNAIYKIYPRLNSVSGYTLRNIKKDKTFEKLPSKVNTPRKIKAYLGKQFTGCLIIMPTEEINMVLDKIKEENSSPIPTCIEENEPHHSTNLESKAYSDSELPSHQISQEVPLSRKRDHTGTSPTEKLSYPFSPPNNYEQEQQSSSSPVPTEFCLVCGKVPTQPNAAPFYDVDYPNVSTSNQEKQVTFLSKKLTEVIKISDLQRNELIPSHEVCNKCFRQLSYIDFMEKQIKRVKEEMLGNFLETLTNVGNMESTVSQSTPSCENTYTTTSSYTQSSTSTLSYAPTLVANQTILQGQNISNIHNQQNLFSTSLPQTLNSNEWMRAGRNTPSPPASLNSVGTIDNFSSTDPSSDDTNQQVPTKFPKPFWKKRYCNYSSESSTDQTHDDIKPTMKNDVSSLYYDNSNVNSIRNIGTDKTQQESGLKRRKIQRYREDVNVLHNGKKVEAGGLGKSEYSFIRPNEYINKRRSHISYEEQRNNELSYRLLAHNLQLKRDVNRQRS